MSEFSSCEVEDKKELLLQNLDPMFNIKAAFFFLSQADCLFNQLKNFCVYDTKHLRWRHLVSLIRRPGASGTP